MHEWTVAGGIVENNEGLLLVQNRRRWGRHDWSPPGGVIDDEDLTVEAGLTREVREETGIKVTAWHGPVYEVVAVAPDMGWVMRAKVFVAEAFEGELEVADPDGIVVDAAFVDGDRCADLLAGCFRWVREPLGDWMEERWDASLARQYHYEVRGTDPRTISVKPIRSA